MVGALRSQQSAVGTKSRAVSRASNADIGTRATMSNGNREGTQRTVATSNSTSEQPPQNFKKEEPAKNTEHIEHRTFPELIQSHFEDTGPPFDLFSI